MQRQGRSSIIIRSMLLFISLLAGVCQAQTVAPQMPFPDFTLPSAFVDFGQRLSEQRGRPVMLVLPGRCNRCDDQLAAFQLLSASYALDDLVTWVIWTPHKNDEPPQLHLPVLRRSPDWPAGAAGVPETPAVLLINRDGVLDHIVQARMSRLADATQKQLITWMSAGQRRTPQP